MAAIPEVDRIAITTVVDNSIDQLRADTAVARRFTHARAGRLPTLRAEHGLAHWVELTRGRETARIALDWGLTDASYLHNLRELGLDPAALDALALSHGHQDHWGGLPGFVRACRNRLRAGIALYAGQDHFLPRYQERDGTASTTAGSIARTWAARTSTSAWRRSRRQGAGLALLSEVRETVPRKHRPRSRSSATERWCRHVHRRADFMPTCDCGLVVVTRARTAGSRRHRRTRRGSRNPAGTR